jgi:hypothetical protein
LVKFTKPPTVTVVVFATKSATGGDDGELHTVELNS